LTFLRLVVSSHMQNTPVTKSDGTCGERECPFFRSRVETGWGIVYLCMKGGINRVPGFDSNIPHGSVACPHAVLGGFLETMHAPDPEAAEILEENLWDLT